MKQPIDTNLSPWRETIDPAALPLSAFKLGRVLDYPHAGNDVFHVEGAYRGEPCRAYIKVERQSGADLRNEIEVLRVLPLAEKPQVLDFSLESPAVLVTRERRGRRLSVLLDGAPEGASLAYMKSYGAALAKIHALDMPRKPVKPRRFFTLPPEDYLAQYGLTELASWLRENPPEGETRCFVHGDFHYANLLWENGALSAVLDWELAGWGVREFDMAWALVLRPGQRFLNSVEEIDLFLKGYGERQRFSLPAFRYYYVLAALHFYALGDGAYRAELLNLLRAMMDI